MVFSLYLAVRGLYATSIFFSYLLQFYVPTNLIFKFLRNEVLTETSEIKLISLELAYRTIVVLITGKYIYQHHTFCGTGPKLQYCNLYL